MAEGQDPTDNTAELDPDRDCNYFTDSYAIQKFEAISSCKDNCKGGKLKTRLSVIWSDLVCLTEASSFHFPLSLTFFGCYYVCYYVDVDWYLLILPHREYVKKIAKMNRILLVWI